MYLDSSVVPDELLMLFRRLERFSALALCEDDSLHAYISNLIEKLNESKVKAVLSEIPEAVLPLFMAFYNHPKQEIRQNSFSCLLELLNKQYAVCVVNY